MYPDIRHFTIMAAIIAFFKKYGWALWAFQYAAACGAGPASNEGNDTGPVVNIASPAVQKDIKKESLSSSAEKVIESPDLVQAGRAFEAGNIKKALLLINKIKTESDKAKYLKAIILHANKKSESAILLLDKIKFEDLSVEYKRMLFLSDCLKSAGDFSRAIVVIDELLNGTFVSSNGQKRNLFEKRGDLQVMDNRLKEAVVSFKKAIKLSGPKRAEKISIKLAEALLAAEQKSEALNILTPLAKKAASARIMNSALSLLKKYVHYPKWTIDDKIDRIKALMDNKAYNLAEKMVVRMSQKLKGSVAVAKELRWLHARLTFDRRRHYEQAVLLLDKVIKDGNPYADKARFLKARALSRMDKDIEAIKEYTKFANRTKNRARADDARFLAARLLFYLGQHKKALSRFERLVGTGKSNGKKSFLGPGRARDAHFLAGMSAILDGKPKGAILHLKAASKGSKSQDAINRNQYWLAVAGLNAGTTEGVEQLQTLCRKDPTSWYSMYASIRLKEKKQEYKSCVPLSIYDKTGADKGNLNGELPAMSLEKLSSEAAFFADIGLFKRAAEVLNKSEKKFKKSVPLKDLVFYYMKLDAPQYAIRRTATGLKWSQMSAQNIWRYKSAYPEPYKKLVLAQEKRHNLPSHLLFAIARKESLFNPFALSYAGAMGMLQMMPATYETNRKRANLKPLKKGALPSAEDSIVAAGFELANLLSGYKGTLPLAIMAYNAGTGAVNRWIERSGRFPMDVFVEKAGFAQTRNYVKRVYKTLVRYRLLNNMPLPEVFTKIPAVLTDRAS
jgi:soluble lytic murein transglycosylase-like protein/thioredoxin-like negative regulator of GroEL